MEKHDTLIAFLMTALDSIRREASKPEGSINHIRGVAEEAIRQCDRQRTRNTDGYLVVKP